MRSALAEARAYTEANMKRILQALQDKLSKEGGAAGFDDLRKTAKSMGLNLTPQMLKNMPGIKQHRDGDYILEGTIDESLDVRYDTKKQGWFDRQGRRRYLGKMATNALMKKALDKAIRTGDFINPYKLKHGQKPEETELEEAFTRKDFQKLETTNDHTEAAEKLINMFGTKEEKFAMAAIKARHNMTGYINGKDYSKRQMMVNKYYSRLK
jgi:hypothetical protein